MKRSPHPGLPEGELGDLSHAPGEGAATSHYRETYNNSSTSATINNCSIWAPKSNCSILATDNLSLFTTLTSRAWSRLDSVMEAALSEYVREGGGGGEPSGEEERKRFEQFRSWHDEAYLYINQV